MKIWILSKSYWQGVVADLKNLALLIKKEFKDEVEIFELYIDSKNIDFSLVKNMRISPPDWIIVGGWDNSLHTMLLNSNRSKTNIILKWDSPIAQTDMGDEIKLFIHANKILENGLIDYMAVASKDDYQILKNINKKYIYTPICLELSELQNVKENKKEYMDGFLNCNLFCTPNVRKNIFTQIMSLSNFNDKKLFTHFNYDLKCIKNDSYTSAASYFLKNQKNHGWIKREEYLGLVKTMDFGMQVTLSESFNYTAAEQMFFKIPVVLSSANPLASNLISSLVVKDATSTDEIKKIVEHLIEDESFRKEMGELCYRALMDKNRENYDNLLEILRKILL